MYTAREELRGNKLRNRKEFAFEGGNWRTVVEEGGVVLEEGTEGAVHPAHLVGLVQRLSIRSGDMDAVHATWGMVPDRLR